MIKRVTSSQQNSSQHQRKKEASNSTHLDTPPHLTPGKSANGSKTDAPKSKVDKFPFWCSGVSSTHGSLPPGTVVSANNSDGVYFLTAVLLVRIYEYDKAQLTTREMLQWLQYLAYAGVEHVYVYDAYLYKNESQNVSLNCFIKNGFVTYVDWSHRAKPKYTIGGTQVSAYQHCLDTYGKHSKWQTAIDIDEYPFAPNDKSPGFLTRYLKMISYKKGPRTSEISMQNYLYLGKHLSGVEHPLLIDRLWRRTIKVANNLVKPIYQPLGVQSANVHHNTLRRGHHVYVPDSKKLRMNHYWGARLQNWGEDTPKILNLTTEDRGMERAVAAMTPCVIGCPSGCC
ncbi:uncharacterized protein LOC117301692 [Asterias rubens]|uniref:uncharacterized protein LOC117301692 n=1 Tax=Asterias rubens TaxID=7604 RepID=UPI0014552AB4|nr:uncharacterized protein LOC117301692 [Asterias rubens]